MNLPSIRRATVLLAVLLLTLACTSTDLQGPEDAAAEDARPRTEEKSMLVQYLEIVTPELNATCDALEKTHGVTFSDPEPMLGNARTASLESGGRIGVRAPMRPTETPVVRPYLLIDDIASAVKIAEAAGATIALPPMQVPGQGTFAIYILGGIEHGLWQL